MKTLHRSRICFLSAAVGLLVTSFESKAFTLLRFGTDTPPLGWNTGTLSIRTNFSQCSVPVEDMNSRLDEAVKLWNSIPTSSIRLERGAETDVTPASAFAGDSREAPIIACASSFSSDTGRDQNSIPGTTKSRVDGGTGRIDYGAIIMNSQAGGAANISTFQKDKLAVIIAHELGHVLGLGHTEEKESLMYFNATNKDRLSLSQDDMDGISYLYPRREILGDGLFGCGTLQDQDRHRNLSGNLNGRGFWNQLNGAATLAVYFSLLYLLVQLLKLSVRRRAL